MFVFVEASVALTALAIGALAFILHDETLEFLAVLAAAVGCALVVSRLLLSPGE